MPDRRPCWDVSSGGSRWPRSGKRCWVTTTLWGNSGSGGPQRPPEPSGPPRRTHTHASRWADERARSQSRRPFPPPGAGAPLRHCPPLIGVGAALGYRTCLTHRFRPRRRAVAGRKVSSSVSASSGVGPAASSFATMMHSPVVCPRPRRPPSASTTSMISLVEFWRSQQHDSNPDSLSVK